MWIVVRTLLIALALTGFIGQTTAHATTVQVFEAAEVMGDMPDCAEMAGMGAAEADPPGNPCKTMTPECVAKMGCTTFAPPILVSPTLSHPWARRWVYFARANVSREGLEPPPLVFPPKHQA